jgi:hypothetical protein
MDVAIRSVTMLFYSSDRADHHSGTSAMGENERQCLTMGRATRARAGGDETDFSFVSMAGTALISTVLRVAHI